MKEQIHLLSDVALTFPNVDEALTEPNGLLAVGGNLQQDTILHAYRKGIFPWFGDDEPILWWSPDPRMVLQPQNIAISKSMKKMFIKNIFRIRFDSSFEQVVEQCAKPRSYTDQTWITKEMRQAYNTLHSSGYAHSAEAWEGDELVGGLYGVAIGKVFFGESMFSKKSNASKMAFISLCQHLQHWQFQLIDCQVYTPHLQSLGASTISRHAFVKLLDFYCPQTPCNANWKAHGPTGHPNPASP
ncbi:MAG: leucyl/phenylalanyl-tRNA--protein transferase [Candidatus Endonucleobacter bathymodioli]|uniref:Leucyl/phenylalanyl-tRNA--protein transferase n=1 Tax=Candidatus Endonucleibacter bathymodioli TaxID=539814 RepID=A0AA90SU60_9GAMM|nr:leucyl/phenylalanyl-tRNA--protein transferase [Candidatus Endonucleobacter bathymodioli]MDP0590370.1 leucyl/phenylalanyl-tRNA--protein transferase [Candidatus Endonucleobacter bathymodioli]